MAKRKASQLKRVLNRGKVAPPPNPARAQLQREQARSQKGFTKQRDAIHGATAAAVAATDATSLKGLKGPYRKQVQQELAGRSASLQNALPGMLAPVQADYKADQQGFADQLADIRADERLDAFEAQQDAQQEARDELNEMLHHRNQKRKAVDYAIEEGRRLLDEIPDEAQGALEDDSTWDKLEEELAKTEGVKLRSARKAVEKLRRELLLNEDGRIAAGPVRTPRTR